MNELKKIVFNQLTSSSTHKNQIKTLLQVVKTNLTMFNVNELKISIPDAIKQIISYTYANEIVTDVIETMKQVDKFIPAEDFVEIYCPLILNILTIKSLSYSTYKLCKNFFEIVTKTYLDMRESDYKLNPQNFLAEANDSIEQVSFDENKSVCMQQTSNSHSYSKNESNSQLLHKSTDKLINNNSLEQLALKTEQIIYSLFAEKQN